MRIVSFEDLPGAKRTSVVTIGVFDGVHRGHRRILELLERIKVRKDLEESWVVTFDRHPLEVLHPEAAPPLITTPEERIELIRELGPDGLLMLPFTKQLSEVGHEDFLRETVQEGLGMCHLVVGYDFHFGKRRGGTPETLREIASRGGFGLDVVEALREERTIISSTAIRKLVLEGRLREARRLLGRWHSFGARVVRGDGRGRDLGFPTANLELLDPRKLVPGRGVYVVRVRLGGRDLGGMMNVGSAPTLGRNRFLPEVHLFDWRGDLYGSELEVVCLQYLRKEQKMPSAEALAARLRQDEVEAREVLRGSG